MCDKRLASPYFGKNNTLAKWYFGNMILWQNNTLAKWYFGNWQNDIVAKKIFWQKYLGIHAGRFPNKHTVQSKRFCKLAHERAAIWMAEEPLLIFTGKTAARTPWSKRTPQEPESCATKSDLDLLIRHDTTAPYCSLRQGWWKIGVRFITTGAGTPGRRRAWTCVEVMRCPYRFSM